MKIPLYRFSLESYSEVLKIGQTWSSAMKMSQESPCPPTLLLRGAHPFSCEVFVRVRDCLGLLEEFVDLCQPLAPWAGVTDVRKEAAPAVKGYRACASPYCGGCPRWSRNNIRIGTEWVSSHLPSRSVLGQAGWLLAGCWPPQENRAQCGLLQLALLRLSPVSGTSPSSELWWRLNMLSAPLGLTFSLLLAHN